MRKPIVNNILRIEGKDFSLRGINFGFQCNCCFEAILGKDPLYSGNDSREHNLAYFGTEEDISRKNVTRLFTLKDRYIQYAFDTRGNPPVKFVENLCLTYGVTAQLQYRILEYGLVVIMHFGADGGVQSSQSYIDREGDFLFDSEEFFHRMVDQMLASSRYDQINLANLSSTHGRFISPDALLKLLRMYQEKLKCK